jgi:hypothetical protein
MTSKRIGRVPCRRSLSTSGKLNPAALAGFFPAGAFCAPTAVAVQAIPVTEAAFFATRLSFESVFRSALFAVFWPLIKTQILLPVCL